MGKVSILDVADMKLRGEKIAMITAYDYTTAQLADRAGIPLVLVGDSLGMVVLGYDSTIPVTMEDMLHHAKAVARGVKQSLIVVDLPFMSYQVDAAQGLANAGRLMQEGGAHSVKLEGGEKIASTVARIVDAGIPVMGHIGLTPQSVHGLGGYRVQGRQREQGEQLIRDALAQEDAGAYSVVLEVVPSQLAGLIPRQLKIPTIGNWGQARLRRRSTGLS
jgi:3-methyl-2-oxobutanoate hydroxymethyltransferase